MADISTLPFRSTPFTGATSAVQPVIPDQIFHATDTNILYIANSLTVGDISPYGGGAGGSGGRLTTGNVTPIGNVTPGAAGEIYIWDNSIPAVAGSGPDGGYKQVYYRSTGTFNTNWEAFGGSAIILIGTGLDSSADFVGQHAYEFSSSSSIPSYSSGYVSYQTGQGFDDWVQTY